MKYRTIVADPPWEMPRGGSGHWGLENQASRLPYPTMALSEIAALPVPALAEDDAHLYLWTTNRYVADSFGLLAGWGFRFSQMLTWAKTPRGIGMGGTFTQTTEHILFARRGQLASATRLDSTWFQWPRGRHSAKPEAFLDLVEQVSPGPYLELFARRNRLGWDTFGDEALEMVTL